MTTPNYNTQDICDCDHTWEEHNPNTGRCEHEGCTCAAFELFLDEDDEEVSFGGFGDI